MNTPENVSKPDSEKSSPRNEFELAAGEKELNLVQEFILFLKENKKWWLIPILASLGLIAALVAISSTGAAPFIYTLF